MNNPKMLVDRTALQMNRNRVIGSGRYFLQELAISEVKDRLCNINRDFQSIAIVTGLSTIWRKAFPSAAVIEDNENLNFLYQQYSKFIPKIGKYIVGDSQPYEYLVKTINEFLNQEELLELIKDQKFENCSYRNLSGGIVSIHSGWKI